MHESPLVMAHRQPPLRMGRVTNAEAKNFVFPADEPVLTLEQAANRMEVPITRLLDMISEGRMITVEVDGGPRIPELFFGKRRAFNKRLLGAIALLHDGGYADEEIVAYLFTADETLPGRPIDALHGHLAREVLRRAQAMAF